MKKVAFYVLGLCASLILWNCKGQNTGGNPEGEAAGDSAQVENPLKVWMPQVEKFVIVRNEEHAEIFKYANVESPWRNRWWEECECDNPDVAVKWSDEDVPDNYICEEYYAMCGTVLAVLGEEGDFYKVSIMQEDCEYEYGFVKKSDVEDAEPAPITEEMLAEMGEMEWGCHYRVLKDGKYKGLVLYSQVDELEGESLEVGVMMNGMMAFPTLNTFILECNPNAQEATITEPDQEAFFTGFIYYPKSMSNNPDDEWMSWLDLNALTDEQIEKIVQMVQQKKSEYVKYEYVFPASVGDIHTFWLKSK